MVEREILQDINGYEPKLIGPVTARQFLCSAAAAFECIPSFFSLNKIFITQAAITIAGALGTPLLACGFYKPYGLPFEKFFISYLKMNWIAPTMRKYKTNNSNMNYIRELTKAEIKAFETNETKELKRIKKERKKELKDIKKSLERDLIPIK